MAEWSLVALIIVALFILIAFFTGRSREKAAADALVETLGQSSARPVDATVDFNSLGTLPPPVARYFEHVLAKNQTLINTFHMNQSGKVRTSTTTGAWCSFTAHQTVVPPATGFVWNAKVSLPLGMYVCVLDSYIAGTGAGRVSLMSAWAMGSEAGVPELNSGALYRYLAEGVWCPTALLPQSGVVWSPIDDRSALATLTDQGITVSLEFRFNDANEVTGIFSPGRFARVKGTYTKMPWEGHFQDYQIREGMLIPMYGEVGWYEGDTLELVWKGTLTDVRYEF